MRGFYAANLLSGLLTHTEHPEDTRLGSSYEISPLPWSAESNRWQANWTLLSRVGQVSLCLQGHYLQIATGNVAQRSTRLGLVTTPSGQHDLDVVFRVPQGEDLGRACSKGLGSSPGFSHTDPADQFIAGTRSGSFSLTGTQRCTQWLKHGTRSYSVAYSTSLPMDSSALNQGYLDGYPLCACAYHSVSTMYISKASLEPSQSVPMDEC